MKNFTKRTFLSFLLIASFFLQNVNAQSVLNPADPLVNWDSTAPPPAEPAWGQIGKWVRTQLVDWNTVNFKSYIYKGTPFRLHFPKTYVPGVADGKKYPMLIFFHGLGEKDSIIYHNELQLKLGHYNFDQAINNGVFDGYVLSIQSPGSFGPVEFTKIREIVDYMIANNKLDPFQLSVNGLSAGGQGAWEMMIAYPTLIASSLPMSWASTYYTDPAIMNSIRSNAIWLFHGGLDGNPAPYTVYQIRDAYASVGANFKNTEYPYAYHATWDQAWGEPDFWGFIKRAYMSNPWPLNGKYDFWPGEAINATLSLTPGFSAYQWRKDGVLLPNTTNLLNVTTAGVYDARVQRDGIWSEWSRIPVQVKVKTYTTLPSKIEAENWSYMNGVQTEGTSDTGGGQNVGWIDFRDWMDYNLSVPTAGTYTLKVRVSTPQPNAQLQVIGTNNTVLATVNIPITGGWQNWQTFLTTVNLPAGFMTLRIINSGDGSWNINWLELTSSNGTVNTAPAANAGADQTITLPANSVTLSGTATDTDGTIATYGWSQVSGPSQASFSNAAAASTTASNLVAGTYTFRLTATDNGGASGTDDVVITVNSATTPPPPPPPSSGTVRIEAESWSSMSGVQTENTSDVGGGLNVGYIDNGDWMSYTINPSTTGSYTMNFRVASQWSGGQFQVRRADGTVITTVDVPNTGGWQTWVTVTKTVNLTAGTQTIRLVSMNATSWNINWFEYAYNGTAPANTAPAANAGADQTITLPANSVTLSGTATDTDGTIATYGWSQVSGPSQASFSNAAAASTTASNLVAGTYTFRLTATDNGGASGTDDVIVTVNSAIPAPPPFSAKIEAENWSAMSGVQTQSTNDSGGGLQVVNIDENDWMDYNVNIPYTGTYTISFRVASTKSATQFQLRQGANILATVNATSTGNLQTWTTVSATVSLTQGQQTLRIYVNKLMGGLYMNWWQVVNTSTGTFSTGQSAQADGLVASGASDALAVYPNPVLDRAMVTVENSLTGPVNVSVFTLNGSLLREFKLNKASAKMQAPLQLQSLPRGAYLMVVQMNGWRKVQKIIRN